VAEQLAAEHRPGVWCVTELRIGELPEKLVQQFRRTGRLVVAEECDSAGSVGSQLARCCEWDLKKSEIPGMGGSSDSRQR
jgi:hypothetical protein